MDGGAGGDSSGGGGLARRLLSQIEEHGETLTDVIGLFLSVDAVLCAAFDGDAGSVPRDRPAIVEISSDRPSVGKTHLLYHIACAAVLPASWNSVTLDGKDGSVVFIDCDGQFDILRLAAIIQSYVHARLSRAIQFCHAVIKADPDSELGEYLGLLHSITPSHVAELTEYALSHIHVYQPESSLELLDTLADIPSHLAISASHNRLLSSILIDGISAFYWLDRSSPLPSDDPTIVTATSDTPPPHKNQTKPSQSVLQSRFEQLTTALRDLSTRFGASIILTNTFIPTAAPTAASTVSAGGNPAPPPFPRHLPACYTYSPRFLSARIVLSQDLVAPFRAGIPLRDAHSERQERMHAVRQAGISAWVGGAGVRRADKSGTNASAGAGAGIGTTGSGPSGWFWFRVAEGVHIDDGDDGVEVMEGEGEQEDEQDEVEARLAEGSIPF
ncbi:hypothetical protein DRE_04486 [Drechslerella stenobrocha 248]|uniref:DNA recombination and repair protein Rad51-like C-terminal domain-containing protein n=1 Tax=Drechslerella stenobrocha 248 TaxID=1043628 RepID=W7IB54_9PEZI|nr:hypothetical protein DRE_04486 [Drechslerella stenobrocha 248]